MEEVREEDGGYIMERVVFLWLLVVELAVELLVLLMC